MLKGVAGAGGSGGQQTLGQDDARAQARPVRTMTAFADPVKTVAGRHNPRVGRGSLQILAEILENRGGLRGYSREVVEGFIHAGGQTRSRNVVAQDSTIDDLCEEAGLR